MPANVMKFLPLVINTIIATEFCNPVFGLWTKLSTPFPKIEWILFLHSWKNLHTLLKLCYPSPCISLPTALNWLWRGGFMEIVMNSYFIETGNNFWQHKSKQHLILADNANFEIVKLDLMDLLTFHCIFFVQTFCSFSL